MRKFLRTAVVCVALCAGVFAQNVGVDFSTQENPQERYEHFNKMKNVGNGLIIGGVVLGTTGVALSLVNSLKAVDAGTYTYYYNGWGQILYYEYDGKRYDTKKELDNAIDERQTSLLVKSGIWLMVGSIGYTAMVAGIPVRIVGRVKANEWKSKIPTAYVAPNGVKLVWNF
jgi:hypothetical protein